MIKTVAAELRRMLHPQMLLNVYYGKKRLPIVTVSNISRFFFCYVLVVALISMILTASGMPMEEALFATASCLASVGPAFGSLGATGTYAEVPDISKLALALAMLLGLSLIHI